MKFFKSIDEKFAEIGFKKITENEFGVKYERNTKFGYLQSIALLHKASGFHLIQSYESGLNKDGFNNCVGLTMYEARLCQKKMKQMGWKQKKGSVHK